jgi:hypothetical protein
MNAKELENKMRKLAQELEGAGCQVVLESGQQGDRWVIRADVRVNEAG